MGPRGISRPGKRADARGGRGTKGQFRLKAYTGSKNDFCHIFSASPWAVYLPLGLICDHSSLRYFILRSIVF